MLSISVSSLFKQMRNCWLFNGFSTGVLDIYSLHEHFLTVEVNMHFQMGKEKPQKGGPGNFVIAAERFWPAMFVCPKEKILLLKRTVLLCHC